MNTAIVDDDAAINLDGRAIVTRRVERLLAIAIGAKPTAPFDAELLLRERRRIRCHEVEINLSLHAHTSRLVAPVRVGVERRCNAPLRPDPQDWHEEDRYEKNTCHPPHVRAPVTGYCGCGCRGSDGVVLGPRHRPARDRHRVAPSAVPTLLDMEEPAPSRSTCRPS